MLGEKLRELRTELNLNMKQASEKLGISYTTYVGYEKNEREPNSETLIKLAENPPLGYGDKGSQTLLENHSCNIIYRPKNPKMADEISKRIGNITATVQNHSTNKGGVSTSNNLTQLALVILNVNGCFELCSIHFKVITDSRFLVFYYQSFHTKGIVTLNILASSFMEISFLYKRL